MNTNTNRWLNSEELTAFYRKVGADIMTARNHGVPHAEISQAVNQLCNELEKNLKEMVDTNSE